MNAPPWCRAKSQLNSAVRAFPTWTYPVGLGAKRTRTFEFKNASSLAAALHNLSNFCPSSRDGAHLRNALHGGDLGPLQKRLTLQRRGELWRTCEDRGVHPNCVVGE